MNSPRCRFEILKRDGPLSKHRLCAVESDRPAEIPMKHTEPPSQSPSKFPKWNKTDRLERRASPVCKRSRKDSESGIPGPRCQVAAVRCYSGNETLNGDPSGPGLPMDRQVLGLRGGAN
jgi:hypothetical protein